MGDWVIDHQSAIHDNYQSSNLQPRQTPLSEDYLVFAINKPSRPPAAEDVVDHHRPDLECGVRVRYSVRHACRARDCRVRQLPDIYRFSVERLSMVRGEMLEMMIVAILVFELVLFFMGIMD